MMKISRLKLHGTVLIKIIKNSQTEITWYDAYLFVFKMADIFWKCWIRFINLVYLNRNPNLSFDKP